MDFFFIDEVSFPCEVECGCYRLCRKRVNIFLKFSRNFIPERVFAGQPRRGSRKRIISNVANESAIVPLVTILLLFRIGVTKEETRESPVFAQGYGAAGRELTPTFLNLSGTLRSAFGVIRVIRRRI